jgi:hypothetical protein
MKTPKMKLKSYLFCLLTLVGTCSASTLLSDFNSLPTNGDFFVGGTWTNEVSFSGSSMTVGSSLADGTGSFSYALLAAGTYSFTVGDVLNYNAQINSSNASTILTVDLVDSLGNTALTAAINTSSWVNNVAKSGSVSLISSGTGNASDIKFFSLTGDGTTSLFRMSINQLSVSAIPEPSTFAALFGAAALGMAACRRRRPAA